MAEAVRRRFRFGLKSLLVVVTLLCIVLASISKPLLERRRQQQLLDQVTALGGRISNLGTILLPQTPGRFLLSIFSASYDRYLLYRIDLSKTKVRDDDLESIAQLKHVKELNLSGTKISDAGLTHLRNAGFLTRLNLSQTAVTDKAVADLLTMDILASLDVTGSAISYEALEKLDSKLRYAHFCEERAIRELKAAGIGVVDVPRIIEGDESRESWIVTAGSEVRDVVVGMSRPVTLTTKDVENLGYLDSLRQMRFHTAKVGANGIASLRQLPNLKDLDFWSVDLTDRDLAAVAKQTQLETLTLYGCDKITDVGFAQLKSLKNLKRLQIYCKGVSQESITELGKLLPECTIIRG